MIGYDLWLREAPCRLVWDFVVGSNDENDVSVDYRDAEFRRSCLPFHFRRSLW